MKIRVIIPVVGTEFNAGLEKEVESVRAPDCEISYVNLTSGVTSIMTRYAEALNTPDIVRLSREAAQQQQDGIFVACFTGAVPVVRELVDIPVVDAFAGAAYTALTVAQKFSVITVVDSVVPIIGDLVRQMGITGNVTSIRNVGIPVLALGNESLLVEKLVEQSQLAIQKDGAEAILLGCTGMLEVTQTVRANLKQIIGSYVPVINPTTASITMLQGLIRNGLSQSRVAYYPATDKLVKAPAAPTASKTAGAN